MKQSVGLFLAVCLVASVAVAAPNPPVKPVKPLSPLDEVETLQGRVTVRTEGNLFLITSENPGGGGLRRFEVEIEGQAPRAFQLQADSAEIHYWRGHLVVVAPQERKALHFSLVDLEKQRMGLTADVPPLTSASDLAELDALLRSRYALTRIDRAVGISSMAGPRALLSPEELRSAIHAVEIDHQDPGGGGLGGCGASCSTNCGDGSSCSTSCTPPRCASCSCPASCSCR